MLIQIVDNTNSKHLELYTILGEYDNAGFPLSYCLLSTVAATEIGKRTKALTAWGTVLCDMYRVILQFVHVDKDMAKIGSCRKTWSQAKIQLCWWHLRKAVRTPLQLAKLSTMPYKIKHARGEFRFISTGFQPTGKADAKECEGGVPGESNVSVDLESMPTTQGPNSLFIQLPNPSQSRPPLVDSINTMGGGSKNVPVINHTPRLTITVPPPNTNGKTLSESGDEQSDNDNDKYHWRTFCPLELRTNIVDMMERHFCAHPLIPGYSAPSPDGIKEWAVKQMYEFCFKHDLREAWAYLWENWYRRGRWELWARCADTRIPRLKTTMMVEAQ
jgi:hypothetical protein